MPPPLCKDCAYYKTSLGAAICTNPAYWREAVHPVTGKAITMEVSCDFARGRERAYQHSGFSGGDAKIIDYCGVEGRHFTPKVNAAPLCKDCAYYAPHEDTKDWDKCMHPSVVEVDLDPIRGEHKARLSYCSIERKFPSDENHCGAEGRNFQAQVFAPSTRSVGGYEVGLGGERKPLWRRALDWEPSSKHWARIIDKLILAR